MERSTVSTDIGPYGNEQLRKFMPPGCAAMWNRKSMMGKDEVTIEKFKHTEETMYSKLPRMNKRCRIDVKHRRKQSRLTRRE